MQIDIVGELLYGRLPHHPRARSISPYARGIASLAVSGQVANNTKLALDKPIAMLYSDFILTRTHKTRLEDS